MNKFAKLLFAMLLAAVATTSTVASASGIGGNPVPDTACSQCAAQPTDCYMCCICAGGNTPGECADGCKAGTES